MLSDCKKCWDTPCTCGYQYKDFSEKNIVEFIERVLEHHDKERILQILNKNKEEQDKK